MISLFGGESPLQRVCSRAGCNNEAQWALLWRNPKIHDVSRRKTWLACEDHREYLYGFLEARSFPLEILPITEMQVGAE